MVQLIHPVRLYRQYITFVNKDYMSRSLMPGRVPLSNEHAFNIQDKPPSIYRPGICEMCRPHQIRQM